MSNILSKLTNEQVSEFLLENPDFLLQNPALLTQLELQQHAQGATSLVHIQQRQLREHNAMLKHKIDELIEHAKENEQIYSLFSECHRQLWTNYDFKTLAVNLRNIICTNAAISECHLLKYDTKFDDLITHRLMNDGTYLGRVSQQERDLLFRPQTQSTALYLIGNSKHPVAILAFGSDDANHFEPAKDSLFVLEFVRSLQLRLLELELA
ncbi:DUF484 family protein [Pseudoalteromonas sp. NEC-BIFX-2020_015]|uniref:DUF484 family protein n=1 Tax=Pseudoalteromonas sp. NEC-BIFX-2020_015 TaxID=2729544 RepID=UPI0014614E78|nr:DUF484 family protein [Pseudoalteromonas sp. NEC-BIFX-2020_015]NMR24543.1 DUF484 family protein [Pseudoalteromonas sp. NEC-BIFX-2020_015]